MGQQESSYRKLDGVARRRTRVKPAQGCNNNNNSDADNVDTTNVDKINVDKPSVDSKTAPGFSLLPSLNWRRTALGAAGDTTAWPGWYHGWCNRAQVHT